jgi:hypothetical protein
MKTLHLLANCYKHDPWLEPDVELLRHLKLETDHLYMPLPESSTFQEGLAAFVSIAKDSDWCDIAEEFLNRAEQFLADVKNGTALSRVRGGRVGIASKDQRW